MNPVTMEVALHYYYCPEPMVKTTAVINATARLVQEGILSEIADEPYVQITMKGKKWIQMLLETPYPEHEWIDPRRYVKVDE